MEERDLVGRIADLERRLAAVERQLGAADAPHGAVPPVILDASPSQRPASPPPLPVSAPPIAPPVVASAPPVLPTTPAVPSATWPSSRPAAVPGTPAGESRNLEQFVGLKLAAWAGGIIVIAGIAIFAKFAIDRGWFASLPPAGKLAMAYLASAAFIGAGIALRRIAGRIPAGALLAAGIGGLYVSTCAGVQPFNVFGPGQSLAVGVAVAIVGGFLTLRMREPLVAGISLFAAYLVPVFTLEGTMTFSPEPSQAVVAGAYVTAIYAVALVLARIGPPRFSRLRAIGVMQAVVGGQLIWQLRGESPAITTGFVGLWWAMAVGECLVAALRGRSVGSNVTFVAGATLVATPLAVLGALDANPATSPYSWLPAAMAAVCVMGAFVAGAPVPAGGIDARDQHDDPRGAFIANACRQLFQAFAVLAGALAIAQVGVVVRGGALPVSWAVMGVGATFAAQRVGNRVVPWLGFASMMLAFLAAAALVIADRGAAGTVVWEFGTGPGIASWHGRITESLWAPGIVAAVLAAGARLWSVQRDAEARPSAAAVLLALAATLLWMGVSLAACDGYAAMAAILLAPTAAAFGRNRSLSSTLVALVTVIIGVTWVPVTIYAAWEQPQDASLDAAAVVVALVVLPAVLHALRSADLASSARSLGLAFGYGMGASALLVALRSVSKAGDPMAVRAGTEWASFALALVGGFGAFASQGERWRSVRAVGVVGVLMSVFLTCMSAILRSLDPVSGMPWVQHWLANPGSLAAVTAGAALVGLRGGASALPQAVRPATMISVVGFVAFTASMVARFFEPQAAPPFESSAAMQRAAVSVWLAMAALGLVIIGFRARHGAVRWTGLLLLAFTAVKVVVFDMAGAEPVWRVTALVATGLLLVGTSVVYSRAMRTPGPPAP